MKSLYFLRVMLLSFEFLLILLTFGIFYFFENQIDKILKININDDITKWIIGLPLVLCAWNFSGEQAKKLLKWNSYWKLKFHIISSVIYSTLFITISLSAWVFFGGINSGLSIHFLIFGIFGQSIIAISIYFAKIRLFEILNKNI